MIQIRVEDDLKSKADALFADLGTDTTTAIRMFLKQSVMRNAIPFEIKRVEDPCYNEHNQIRITNSIEKAERKEYTCHDLIEVLNIALT